MRGRGATLAAAALLGLNSALAAQRPQIGLGVGGGVVLGSQLFDAEDHQEVRQVDLNDVAVASIHGEWYVTPHVAVRGHAAWGGGRLEVNTTARGTDAGTSVETGDGDVRVTAYDAGISIWPWAPGTIGFAPFLTVGVGTFGYDFDDVDGASFFRARGKRTERAFLVGLGADMSVWRSIMLRMEAMNHLVDSPLQASDFAAPIDPRNSRGLGESVSNVRLVIGAHVYLPFGSARLTGGQ